MEPNTDIKRRPDGSIDTGYYMQQGRKLRSAQAHRLAGKFIAKPAANRPGIVRRLFGPLQPART